MMPFTGQTEKAGHFLQPATRAIGHSVIGILLDWQSPLRTNDGQLPRFFNRGSLAGVCKLNLPDFFRPAIGRYALVDVF
jgi:hypothetical protein